MAKITTPGASLYVPATHKNLAQIASGDLRSVISLHRRCPKQQRTAGRPRQSAGGTAPYCPMTATPALCARAQFDVLDALLQMPGIEHLTGL